MVIVFEFRKLRQTTKDHTYQNTDVCGCPLTQWCAACRVSKKNTALAIDACPKGNADSTVLVFEKDGHLQLCPFDVPPYIDRGKW
jgi:hypothetical protein